MDEYYYKYYIRLDTDKNIVHGFSDAFEQPQDGDICINEQGGRHFELFGVINPPLRSMDDIYLYHYIDNQVVPKTPEEIQTETPEPEPPMPTLEEQVRVLTAAVLEMAGEFYRD